MTLQEFIAELKNDVISFELAWRKGQEDKPDQWPDEMPEGDWWEQYLAHVTATIESKPEGEE